MSEVLFQPRPGATYRIFGESLLVGDTKDSSPFLITMFASMPYRQTFDNEVILRTFTDANREHIRTGGRGSELVFRGGIVQHPSSKGLGIHLRDGDFVLEGDYDDGHNLTKIHGSRNGGRFIVRGQGIWKGEGNFQIDSGATVVLESEREDGLSFAPRGVQLMDGTLHLQGDNQIAHAVSVQFASSEANRFLLDGQQAALNKLNFVSSDGEGILDLGEGGVLRLLGQDPNDTWGHLLIRGWRPDSGGIRLEGGLFHPLQLQKITFEGYAPGAKILNGQLLPAGEPLSAVFGGEPLATFICAGQSNMVGARSERSLLPEGLAEALEDVWIFNDSQWVPMTVPERGFGPEVTFAIELRRALRRPVGIIYRARGGSSLASDWSPQSDDSLYAELRRKVIAASRQQPLKIHGMIWMQGERDSRDPKMAAAYRSNLENFIERARADFNAPEMTFVAGRVNPHFPDGPLRSQFSYASDVRAAQEGIDLKGYGWIDCDDLSKINDHLHYDTAGIVEMGHRFATKLLELSPELRN
ncbi:sialate O-acetylesterase [Coraliomargarita sp. W4R53]